MMTKLYFVRHAQSLHPWEDDRTRPLTEEGRQDSAQVTEFFKDKQVDAIYCSPYRRSLDTIAGVASTHGKKIQTDERLRERKAAPGSNNRVMFLKRWNDLSFHEEGGESIGQVQERNIEAVREILKRQEGRSVVIGTHGTALSSILRYYDASFGCDDFLRIINWMPYIVELTFEGDTLLQKTEHLHVEKAFLEKRLKELDWHNYEEDWPVLQRYAVRGIIRDEKGRYALVQSKKYGECKFPGGGMEDGETREETLIREVEEETGMQVRPDSIRYFGETLERKRGYREEQTVFEQHSYYYFCQVDADHMGSQHLTEDEEELGYTLVWLSMEEALEQMRKVEAQVQDWLWHIPWLKRDTCVMELLLG